MIRSGFFLHQNGAGWKLAFAVSARITG